MDRILYEASLHLPEPFTKVALSQYCTQVGDFLMGKRSALPPRPVSNKTPHTKQDGILWQAIEEGQPCQVIKQMIASGADINARDKDGRTALHMAVRKRNPDLTKLFLEAGANISTTDDYGNAAIHYSSNKTLKQLLAAGADINMPGNFGYTPLHYAIAREDKKLVRMMVQNGADMDASSNDDRKRTPLMVALGLNPPSNMPFLLVELGANVNKPDINGLTPLTIVTKDPHFAGTNRKGIKTALEQAGAKNQKPTPKPYPYSSNANVF